MSRPELYMVKDWNGWKFYYASAHLIEEYIDTTRKRLGSLRRKHLFL